MEDWKDGFLFVGNHPTLDLLNTCLLMEGEMVDLLPDWDALVRWFRASGLAGADEGLERWTGKRGAQAALEEVKRFRESLRETVVRLESGKNPPNKYVQELNRLLHAHPMLEELREVSGRFVRQRRFDMRAPDDLLAPLAAAAAELLADLKPERLRQCENCVVHFYDTSKNATRRWCSMQLCGNRLKVAAYARRKRGVDA